MCLFSNSYALNTEEGRSMCLDRIIEELNYPTVALENSTVRSHEPIEYCLDIVIRSENNYSSGSQWYYPQEKPFKERCECYVTRN